MPTAEPRAATRRPNMEHKKSKIGVWGLLVIGFFWVHGGIYGNEAMLMAAPPAYVFVMLGIVPFVYSLPIALIVAELSTAFPEDGGYVVWVRDACGHAVGSHHAYWVWVIYVVDAAVYPVLVSSYVDTMVPMGATNRGLLSVGIVLAVTAINLLGTDIMVKFNTVLAILSLLPTLVFTVYGLPELQPAKVMANPYPHPHPHPHPNPHPLTLTLTLTPTLTLTLTPTLTLTQPPTPTLTQPQPR